MTDMNMFYVYEVISLPSKLGYIQRHIYSKDDDNDVCERICGMGVRIACLWYRCLCFGAKTYSPESRKCQILDWIAKQSRANSSLPRKKR